MRKNNTYNKYESKVRFSSEKRKRMKVNELKVQILMKEKMRKGGRRLIRNCMWSYHHLRAEMFQSQKFQRRLEKMHTTSDLQYSKEFLNLELQWKWKIQMNTVITVLIEKCGKKQDISIMDYQRRTKKKSLHKARTDSQSLYILYLANSVYQRLWGKTIENFAKELNEYF